MPQVLRLFFISPGHSPNYSITSHQAHYGCEDSYFTQVTTFNWLINLKKKKKSTKSKSLSSSFLAVCLCAQGKYAFKLLNDLFVNYTSALRPVEDTDNIINVTLQITLSQIIDMVMTLDQSHILSHSPYFWAHFAVLHKLFNFELCCLNKYVNSVSFTTCRWIELT